VDARDILFSRVFDAVAQIRKSANQLGRTTRDFAHELQGSLRLTVVFSNIYCEL